MSARSQVTAEELFFVSGRKRIGVRAWRSRERAAPAIVVLHGAGGLDAGNRYISHLAQAVAARGFHTFLLEYFDRTGTVYANEAAIEAHAPAWLETIRDAIDFIAALPGSEGDGVGIFGYSLGGYLAVARAAQDERVHAVVELAGGVDAETAAVAKRLPPMLIVHGREDQRVPVARAVELQQLCEKLHTPVQTLILPGERHLLSPAGALVAMQQAMRFFHAHLDCRTALC